MWTAYGTPETDPEGWRVLREAFGREAIEKAFGTGGGGLAEIEATLTRAQEQSV